MDEPQVEAEALAGAEELPTSERRKLWQTPKIIVSELARANHASDPPTSDGTPASQLS